MKIHGMQFHRPAELHAVNLHAQQVLGRQHIGSGNKSCLNQPFRASAGKEGPMVVQVLAFNQVVHY
jgi:hypothetical protein